MIEDYLHIKELSCPYKGLCDRFISIARLNVTRGVVVSQDDSISVSKQGFLEHLTRMDQRTIQGSPC